MIEELEVWVEGPVIHYEQTDYQNETECDILLGRLPSDQDRIPIPAEQKKKKEYITKNSVGDTDNLPEKILNISIEPYYEAFTFKKNKNAYMVLKDVSKKIPEILTLKYIQGAFFDKYKDEIVIYNLDEIPQEWLEKTVTFYLSDFFDNTGKTDGKVVQETISEYRNLVGILPGDSLYGTMDRRLPVIEYYKYDRKTITISSPYIMTMLIKVEKARIEKKKKYPKRYRGDYLPAGYSYRLDPKIIGESCKRAADVVSIVATVIDRAGDPVKKDKKGKSILDENGEPVIDEKRIAHISFREIINRAGELRAAYEACKGANKKNKILKSTFEAAWKLLPEYTDLVDVYKNIELPDPNDKKYVPTSSRLGEVLEFKHYGKI